MAIGRPMLFEFRYSAFNAPMVACAASMWKHSRLMMRNATPTAMAEANATTIDEWKMSKIGSLERIANIRHGLHTKKLKRLSTICALDPPMRSRAATYPVRITMPMTQNPCNAFSSPMTSPCLYGIASAAVPLRTW